MTKTEFVAKVVAWAQDSIIARHEGCQNEGGYEITFSLSPEALAQELWERMEFERDAPTEGTESYREYKEIWMKRGE